MLEGSYRHAVFLPEEPPRLVVLRVDPLVEDVALGGEAIVGPELLDVDEGELPLAVGQVLEAGDGDQVVLGIHGSPRQSASFIVSPHPEDPDDMLLLEQLVD